MKVNNMRNLALSILSQCKEEQSCRRQKHSEKLYQITLNFIKNITAHSLRLPS